MEHEELLIELKAHELEEKQTTLDRKRLEDEIRRRLDAKLGLEEQIRDVELRRALRAAEEEEFHLEQQRLVAEQDRLELLTREAQRSKKLENQRALRDLLERREASRKAQIAQLIQEHNDLIELEKRRYFFARFSDLFSRAKPYVKTKRRHFPFRHTGKRFSNANACEFCSGMLTTSLDSCHASCSKRICSTIKNIRNRKWAGPLFCLAVCVYSGISAHTAYAEFQLNRKSYSATMRMRLTLNKIINKNPENEPPHNSLPNNNASNTINSVR